MRNITAIAWVLAVTAVAGTPGCIGGRSSPATRYYVLTTVMEIPTIANSASAAPVVIGVGPVHLPAYLDRPQLVIRRAPASIEISEFERWGEPLRDGTSRVVAINLARLLPQCRVVPFPWRSSEGVNFQVVLDIEQLDGSAGGNATLDARWRVLDALGRETAAGVSRVSEPASVATTAEALSRLLAALTRDIARDLPAAAMAVAVTGE